MKQNNKNVDNAKPIVSICCLVYNHEKFLKQTLDSFLMQQTSFPFEVVIHDDASTDSSADIIRSYEAKHPEIFKPIYQTENQKSKFKSGMNPRFNFPRAKGKYIAVCEGDDYWTDSLKLQKQVEFLDNNEDYILCYHDVAICNNKGELISDSKTPDVYKRNFTGKELLKSQIFICTMSLMFRNSFESFPIEYFYDVNGDVFITSFLGQFGHGKYFKDISGVYRVHGLGIWSSLSYEKKQHRKMQTFYQLYKYYRSIENFEISNYYKNKYIQFQKKIKIALLKKWYLKVSERVVNRLKFNF